MLALKCNGGWQVHCDLKDELHQTDPKSVIGSSDTITQLDHTKDPNSEQVELSPEALMFF
jgi:hypothetical protein